MTGKPNTNSAPVNEKNAANAAGVILLIEDEDIVRSLARRLLESKGFVVLEAATINDARVIWGNQAKEIDLLLSDVQLPDGSTIGLVREMQREKPELRIIFTSGYSEDVLGLKRELSGAAFVQKPFHPRDLMDLIDQALRKDK